jgi:hypothetical protein
MTQGEGEGLADLRRPWQASVACALPPDHEFSGIPIAIIQGEGHHGTGP